MSVSIIVGGQYGSEAKGKVAFLTSLDSKQDTVAIRCGGPNSGHIVIHEGTEYSLRHIPTGAIHGTPAALAPAALIDLEVLRSEIHKVGLIPDRLSIDPFSAVITEEMKHEEGSLVSVISSTGSGTGAATVAKCLRKPDLKLIKDVVGEAPWLKPYVRDVRTEINRYIVSGYRIIIEGTQGFGLSLHHSRLYPQTTSKDTTAAQFIMEAGLSPLLVDEIIMAVRTFPIRVSGQQAGPLKDEITWDTVREESGYPFPLSEVTTVTQKQRRVGRFDPDLVLDACHVNRPTALAVHGMDYLGYENHGATSFLQLNERGKTFLQELKALTGVRIKYAFTGRDNTCVIRDVEEHLPKGCSGNHIK